MRIDPWRLLVLRAVADAGGVVAAGERLHLAPSGVSQHMAALERETGLVLLDRSRPGGRRSAELTAAGRRVVEHANRLAEVLADAEADVRGLTGELAGEVRLAAFQTAIRSLVVPALATLARTAPAVRPIVQELDEPLAVTALHAGELDVVLVEDAAGRTPAVRRGTRRQVLLDDPYRLTLPREWPIPRTLADLADRPWVSGPPGSAVARVLDRLRRTTQLALPASHSCVEFPAVLALVSAGLGAALVPELALTDAARADVRVLDLPGLGTRTITALHARTTNVPPPVRALLDALTEAARSLPGDAAAKTRR